MRPVGLFIIVQVALRFCTLILFFMLLLTGIQGFLIGIIFR